MKLNRLETHDRLLVFSSQADNISQGCADCIRNRPEEFKNLPFYIFAHKRQIGSDERFSLLEQDHLRHLDDPFYERKYYQIEDVPTTRLIWIPRLSKPVPQENSMLFKAYPPSDAIKVIWILPEHELWPQYAKDKMTRSDIVSESIHNFLNNNKKLMASESDDLSEDEIDKIYERISKNEKYEGKA